MIYSNGTAATENVYNDEEDQDDLLRAEEQFAEDMQAGLSDDAPWKRIQQNTFTRWANEHLKVVNRQINDLQYDLSDGLLLIALIEILSQKKLPKHNKKTTFRSQKLENVSVALDFLENVEQIKLVNIDASHIVDGRLKLILGLIWTLILHYYISLPRWESMPMEEQKPGREPTPKQKLMGWVRNMLPPDLPITNFTTDWNDGRAIGALVDACAPGLYPDWVDNDPKNALKNTREAMDLAKDWLGIPQLIRPEEMIDPNVDDRSMMTYLSQYPSAKLKPGAPLRPKTNAALARCYGKGIEPVGNFAGEPTEFFVETKQAGVGKLNVILLNPRGQQEMCDIAFQNDPNRTFRCKYTPSTEGQYKVIVKYANQEVPGSPFSPFMDRHPANVNACRAYGPGLESEVTVDKPTWFEVDHSQAGKGRVESVIVDPNNQEVPVVIKPVDSGKSRGEYVPRVQGPHAINVLYDGQPIPGSPFNTNAVPDPNACRAYGRGVEPTGVNVGENADFKVVTTDKGDGVVRTAVLGPDGYDVPCSMVRTSPQSYDCSYIPRKAGPHHVNVTYDGKHIPQSPFNVMVAPSRAADVKAYGPGLKGGVVGQPAEFVTETTGNPEDLSFSVEGPDKVKLTCEDRGNGVVGVCYYPTTPGPHAIHVLNNAEEIPGSPFNAWIEQKAAPAHASKVQPVKPADSSRVHVYGPGIEPGVKVNTPTYFIVDCKEAGPGDVSVALTDPLGRDLPLHIEDLDGAFSVGYTPQTAGPHTVTVLFGNTQIAGSPIKVDVEPGIDVSKIYPEEFNPNPVVNRPNQIKMNTMRAGPVNPDLVSAKVSPAFPTAPLPISSEVVPTNTGFGINYQVPKPGPYTISPIVHGVPLEALNVEAVEPVDPSKVRVYGPGLVEGVVNQPSDFTIDMGGAGPGELRVAVEGPAKPKLTREDNNDESCRVTYVPAAPGDHLISVLFDDQHVPGSPFRPVILPAKDARQVRAYGPGIDPSAGVSVGCQTEFTVDARPISSLGGDDVQCSLHPMHGAPYKAAVIDNRNGTYTVRYTPERKGPLEVDVRYEGTPIPGSPFPMNVADPLETGRVRCYGPGLESAITHQPAQFTIDTTDAGPGHLDVAIDGPGDAPLVMKQKVDGVCVIEYVPTRPGQYEISIMFNGKPIPSCPYIVPVVDRPSANQVRVIMPDHPLRVNVPSDVIIDGTAAAPGVPSVSVVDPYGISRPVPVRTIGTETTFPAARPRGSLSGPSPTGSKYAAELTPATPGVHQVNVEWSGVPVPGSPFNAQALPRFEPDKVTVSGPGIRPTVPASLPTEFTVDTKAAGQGQLDVLIRTPDNSYLDRAIDDNKDGTYTIHYLPVDPGSYNISVSYDSLPILNSPFTISVIPTGDPTKCRISGNGILAQVPVGEQCIIHVDATEAGPGAVTATIVNQAGIPIDFDIIDTKIGTFDIVYVPPMPGQYTIKIRFGGQDIPHGTFVVRAGDDQSKLMASVGQSKPLDFRLPVGGAIGDVTAVMRTPSGKRTTPLIEDNQDGTVSIKYHPTEVGEHELSVFYQGVPVQGSPYKFTVDRVTDGYVTAYGPGLSFGISGEPCHFKVVTKDAGAGSLAVAVEGPSKAEIRCKDNKDGTCDATYWPTAPGDYVITIKYGGKHIAGSPFHAKIVGTGVARAPYSPDTVGRREVADASRVRVHGAGLDEGYINVANEFVVDSRDAGNGPLAIAIEGPSKANIECPNKDDGTCVVSYKVSEPGTYYVSVKFAEAHVPGSPYTVKVHGPGEPHYRSATTTSQASSITTTNPADYLYRSRVVSDKLSQSVQMQNVSASASRIGSPCELCLRLPGVSPGELTAFVTSPRGRVEDCEVIDVGNQCKSIRFTPKETGIHSVSVKRNGQHIAGSPYQFTVGPIAEGGAQKVHLSGRGLSSGIANVPCEFNVYTREAGSGCLTIQVEGPVNAEINFQEVQDGNGVVSYTCPEPGDYSVAVKFNDQHVPGSPFSVHIEPAIGGVGDSTSKRITIEDIHMPRGKKHHEINVPLSFNVSTRQTAVGSPAKIEAHVISPNGKEEPCTVHQSKEGDKDRYDIRFVPRESGVHRVHVRCNGRELADSPFEFVVGTGPSSSLDSRRVVASGRGLHEGIVGRPCEFFVDTSQAGTGLLAVVVDGPSKVQLDCKESSGGYNVSFVATAAGEYTISIKFAGNTIAGSPYKCHITDSGDVTKPFITSSAEKLTSIGDRYTDGGYKQSSRSASGSQFYSQEISSHHGRYSAASAGWAVADAGMKTGSDLYSEPQKVRTYGTGIMRAKRDEQTEFTVDATEAGHNMLMVGILGPSRPCEEVLVKHIGKNVYNVSYIVREKGSYVLIVKWGDSHIPGSPFYIEVP